jgi:hypothetical protein
MIVRLEITDASDYDLVGRVVGRGAGPPAAPGR